MQDLVKCTSSDTTPKCWTSILPSYKLPDIKAANVISLGVLKGAWCWLANIVRLKDFAVEVHVSVDSILHNVPV